MSSDNIVEETCPLLPLTSSHNNRIEIPNVTNTGRLGNWFPFGFFYELRKLVKLAVPICSRQKDLRVVGQLKGIQVLVFISAIGCAPHTPRINPIQSLHSEQISEECQIPRRKRMAAI
ncbi:hypothetical protein P879_06245 [Paragonimus westermani]|uniref:Uncharacterized protein n=1 Tax=Paragonimus westermani TaxID=34504 RepID=A0A8T0DXM7_9TREM|nr:hypothetical protein P879_06245 [Paragonimus westermani]